MVRLPRGPSRASSCVFGLPLLAVALLSISACGDAEPEPYGQSILGPLVAGSQVIFADRHADELLIVAVDDDGQPAFTHHAVDGEPDTVMLTVGEDAVLSLSAETGILTRVALDDGVVTSWDVGGSRTGLSLSPDGDLVMVHARPNEAGSVFTNPNEVAFVRLDIDADADDALVNRTLTSLGGSPEGVFVSPEVSGTRYALVTSKNHVSVVSLSGPLPFGERSVPLSDLAGGATRTPIGAAFGEDPDTGDLWALVQTSQGASAFGLQITPTVEGFDVRINQLPGVSPGGAVALTTLPDQGLVAVLLDPYSGSITRTVLSTGLGFTLDLEHAASRLRLLDATTALLWASDSVGSFHVVELDELETKKGKAVRTRFAGQQIQDLIVLPDGDGFVALHPGSQSAVSIVDAETDRVTAFDQTGSLEGASLREDAGQLIILTSRDGWAWLVTIDLETLHPTAVQAPVQADYLLALEPSGTLVTYDDTARGTLSIWPGGATDEVEPIVVIGLFFDGALERLGGDSP